MDSWKRSNGIVFLSPYRPVKKATSKRAGAATVASVYCAVLKIFLCLYLGWIALLPCHYRCPFRMCFASDSFRRAFISAHLLSCVDICVPVCATAECWKRISLSLEQHPGNKQMGDPLLWYIYIYTYICRGGGMKRSFWLSVEAPAAQNRSTAKLERRVAVAVLTATNVN